MLSSVNKFDDMISLKFSDQVLSITNYQFFKNFLCSPFSSLHFKNEIRVQESQQVKYKKSHISVFVAYLTIPNNR